MVIASEEKQSLLAKSLKSRDCFVAVLLAMTQPETFYKAVNFIDIKKPFFYILAESLFAYHYGQ